MEENHPAFTRGKEVRRAHCHGPCCKPATTIGAITTASTYQLVPPVVCCYRIGNRLVAEQDFRQARPLG